MNETINCIIIDDEPLARELLKKHVSKIPFLILVGEYSNAYHALSILNKQNIQLLFIDIEMPSIDGLTFTKSIIDRSINIVFTTAYSEYAVQAFDRDAVDYLLKPITFERFLQSINKVLKGYAIKYVKNDGEENEMKLVFTNDLGKTLGKKNAQEEKDVLLIKENKKYIKVSYSDIIIVEGMKDYIKVLLMSDKTIITHMTMAKMETMLPTNTFVRINRSYIINKNMIKFVDGNTVEMISGKQLMIGINYREIFKTYLREGRI